ncbi:MAG: toll/interleukin-1 receptor domain-containing protein [Firmicutes bacterium]|nr:toll/interleukin-1 receptor domain-containing protein [Bacillota bacterium]
MKTSIFISYSHQDAAEVRKIAESIQSAGIAEVWYDTKLRGGENYFSVIANQIIACEYLIFIVSDHSIQSDWCLRELEFAASEQKKILAVWLKDVDISPRVRLIIQSTQYINFDPSHMDAFSHAIVLALEGGGATGLGKKKEAPAERDVLWNEKKYFIEDEKIRKIDELLKLEQQGKYSTCFLPENAVLLGLAYELGLKTEANARQAEFYYKVARFYGNSEGKYLYAALKQSQDPENLEYLKDMDEAVQEESVFALTHVGDDYYYGRNGREKDVDKAYRFWQIAAERGSATAMYYLAFGYRKGEGVPKDLDLAYMYALRSSEYDFPRAFRILAFLYEDGELAGKDYDKAIEMYDKAIARGDFLSYSHKGWVLGDRGDIAGKVECYKKAYALAEEGKIKSGMPYYRMGYVYENGQGVEKDLKKAIELYMVGAERGHKNSIRYMVSTIKDLDRSEWEPYLKRAFDLHCPGAAYELGYLEKEKDSDHQLSAEGVRYFERGAQEGDMSCAAELISNYSFIMGRGDRHKDRDEAIRWFQFFFANMDAEYKEKLKNSNLLEVYYYAFAVELDYEGPNHKPDREFVQYYFKKSLEACPRFLPRIVGFIVDGYLFPEESNSGFTKDVAHAEEMLPFVERYLPAYEAYIEQAKDKDEPDDRARIRGDLKRGYQEISECYRTGKGVPRNRDKAAMYKLKAR